MVVKIQNHKHYNGICDIPCDEETCTPTINLNQKFEGVNGGAVEHGIIVSQQCSNTEKK